MSSMRGVYLLVLGGLAVGCETADERPPRWSYVHAAIIAPSCATASCHSQISSAAGRDLSTPEHAYAALTGRTCGAPSLPGEPSLDYVESVFLQSLYGYGERGANGPGERDLLMPPEGPLSDVDIDLIERWYAAGAKCD